MKRYIYITLAMVAGVFAFVSCNEDENITPSGNYSPIRGAFPQGDSEYDALIKQISEEYGVYLLYKDITEQDLNREWTSTGTGPVYVGGPKEERENGVWNLPDEYLPFYVNFFYNYIFPNITPEFAQSTFPVKIYMIDNLRSEPRDFSEGEEGESSTPGTDTEKFESIKLGNFDNWAISFKDDVVNGGNDELAIKKQRCMFMNKAIWNARSKNEIIIPDEFWNGYVFSSKDTLIYDNPESEHYNYKLGFPDDIYYHFATTGNSDDVWRPTLVVKHTDSWHKDNIGDGEKGYDLFGAFIRNAMWLTPDEFTERYSPNKYPMVKEKYDLVVNLMKETYGIDLVGIAKGLDK